MASVLCLAALALASVPRPAEAQLRFRLPLDCSGGVRCYVTAYYDLNRNSGAIRDYTCATKTYDQHTGSDYGVGSWAGMDEGRVIVAPADGTVNRVVDGLYDRNTSASNPPCGTASSCGNLVRILHDDGTVTLYCHLKKDSLLVVDGQRVSCGQPLGEVGSSGCSTGPHLHLGYTPPGGSATDPYRAEPTSCGRSTSMWVEQGPYLGLPGSSCQCTPDCSGRQCGGDGCGGSCGSCAAGICDESSGRCIHDAATLDSEDPGHGEEVFAGTVFSKQWTIRNSGNTTWSRDGGYSLAFDGGERLGGPEQFELGAVEEVGPGESRVFVLDGTAPSIIGTYVGHYRMRRGEAGFGDRVRVEIEVGADFDGDGHHAEWAGGDDCDDEDPEVYPGAEAVCDGKDNDCSGVIDDLPDRDCDRGCGPGVERCVDGRWVCDAPRMILGRCLGYPHPPFETGEDPDDPLDEEPCELGEDGECVPGVREIFVSGTAGCGCGTGAAGGSDVPIFLILLVFVFSAALPTRVRRRGSPRRALT